MKPLDEKITLKSKMFPTFGYGGEDYIPGPFEEDDIITGIESPFDLGSIINPTENLIGSEMIITIGLESKTIALGSDILSKMISFKDLFQHSYIPEGHENRLEPSIIPGISIDQNPPYIGTNYTVKIVKNHETYREIEGSIRVRDFSYNNIDITSNPKVTVFARPGITPRDNKRYIYSQSNYNNGYLIVYRGQGFSGATYWIPLFACKLTKIDDSPAIITLKEDLQEALGKEGLYVCITKTLDGVNVVSAGTLYKK